MVSVMQILNISCCLGWLAWEQSKLKPCVPPVGQITGCSLQTTWSMQQRRAYCMCSGGVELRDARRDNSSRGEFWKKS
ncbi:hypothetical protein C0J52_01687 [Blattella germanica]|nr:hypothetical protein C0J52_01687 [Blattella germanica]